jgi:hypothetical protein
MNKLVFPLKLAKRSSSSMQPGDELGELTVARPKDVPDPSCPRHRAVRLAIYLLVAAIGIAGCASQDRRILAKTGDLKTETLALMDKAVEPYSAHAEEIDAQNAQLERLYDQERTRPGLHRRFDSNPRQRCDRRSDQARLGQSAFISLEHKECHQVNQLGILPWKCRS